MKRFIKRLVGTERRWRRTQDLQMVH